MYLKGTIQLDFNLLMRPLNLPWVLMAEPVVRLFLLPSILDCLLKNAILIPQAIAYRGQLHRCHRVQEASRQSPQSTVTEASIGLLFKEPKPIKVFLFDSLFSDRINQKIGHIVGE